VLRIPSGLSDDVEAVIHSTIGCCIAVHRVLGPGLLENIYCRATRIELAAAGLSFEAEKEYSVEYRGVHLCRQRLDLVVSGQVILEVKAIDHLAPVHHAQLLSYLRVARLRVGLLINFNVPILRDGVKRIVL
jgi:GxxExxY protein